MTTPTSINDLYPPKWVKAADLNGQAVPVTIKAVTVEEFYIPQINDTKTQAVLSFEGKTKRLILNKTQVMALAATTSSDVFSDWVGQRVELVAARAANGKPTIAIKAVANGK